MSVVCNHCHEEIKFKSDLLVTSNFFQFNAYHESCFNYKKKHSKLFAVRKINGYQGIWTIAVFIFLFIINMRSPSFKAEPVIQAIWFGFILAVLLERLYSYIKYERKLKKPSA